MMPGDNKMDELTKKVLSIDTISEVEKMLGKNWQEFTNDENLAMLDLAFLTNTIKTSHLKEIGDTHSQMTWNEFKYLLGQKGFVNAYSYDFEYDGQVNEFIIYYNSSKGWVICATSYSNKTTVNGGNFYAEIEANSKESRKDVFRWMGSGGLINKDGLVLHTSHDVRDGLFSKVEELEKYGKYLNKWTDPDRFLWFLDFSETKVPNYNFRNLTKNKIEKCPDDFRQMIGQ
jgi:hypothetical protein